MSMTATLHTAAAVQPDLAAVKTRQQESAWQTPAPASRREIARPVGNARASQ
jgi:hypothetical protein